MEGSHSTLSHGVFSRIGFALGVPLGPLLYLGTLFPGQRLSLLGFSRLPHHHPGLFSLKSGLPGSYSVSVPSG